MKIPLLVEVVKSGPSGEIRSHWRTWALRYRFRLVVFGGLIFCLEFGVVCGLVVCRRR